MKKFIVLLLASIATFAHAAGPRPYQPIEIHFHNSANVPAEDFLKEYNRITGEFFSLGLERFETACRMERPLFNVYGKDIIVVAELACDAGKITTGDLRDLANEIRTSLSIDLRIPMPPPGGGASSHN